MEWQITNIFVVKFHRNIYVIKFMEFQFQTVLNLFLERTRNIKVDSISIWKSSDFGNSFDLNTTTNHQRACTEPFAVCSRNVLGTANHLTLIVSLMLNIQSVPHLTALHWQFTTESYRSNQREICVFCRCRQYCCCW